MSYIAQAHIHSLNGEMKEVTVLDKIGDNLYVVDYEGTKCTALYNPLVGIYYADDKYGVISERDTGKANPSLGDGR